MPEDPKIVFAIIVLVVMTASLAVLTIVETQRQAEYQQFLKCRGFPSNLICALQGSRTEASIVTGGGTFALCLGLGAPLHVASFGLSTLGCAGLGALAGGGTYFALGGTIGSLFGGIILPILIGLLGAGYFGGLGITITKTNITFAPLGLIGFIVFFLLASWIVANWLLLLVIGIIVTAAVVGIRYKMGD